MMGTAIMSITSNPIANRIAANILCDFLTFVFTSNVRAEVMNNNVADGPNITNSIILRKPYDNPVAWLKSSRIRMHKLHNISQVFVTSIIFFFYFLC